MRAELRAGRFDPRRSDAVTRDALPMRSTSLDDVARHLDALLRTSEVPDYPGALNGVQVEHAGPVTRCAVAVDASLRTIEGAIDAGANLLIVHHGLFWGGAQPLRGRVYRAHSTV